MELHCNSKNLKYKISHIYLDQIGFFYLPQLGPPLYVGEIWDDMNKF